DVYAYYGVEQVDANFFNVGTTLFGLGNPGFSNATCLVTTPFSFAGNTPADCIANNRTLTDLTVGFWQNVYKGDYGRVAFRRPVRIHQTQGLRRNRGRSFDRQQHRLHLGPVLSVLTNACGDWIGLCGSMAAGVASAAIEGTSRAHPSSTCPGAFPAPP